MSRDSAGISPWEIIARHWARKMLRALGMITIREREYDFIGACLRQITPPDHQGRQRVMDVGSSSSLLPWRLARQGYEVVAVDIRPYPFRHRNLMVMQADITDAGFGVDILPVDVVICVSTLEHIGLGYYGDGQASQGDELALAQFQRLIKPGGSLLLTVPFAGEFSYNEFQRVYDVATLERLFARGWRLKSETYFIPQTRKNWRPATRQEASRRYPVYPEANNACFWLQASQ